MYNFTFHNPTKILFGKGQIAAIAQEIPEDQRILITYGGGSIKRNGVYDQVMAALAGRTLFEFPGIEPNPTCLYSAVKSSFTRIVSGSKLPYPLKAYR